jgi:hypothetical protein
MLDHCRLRSSALELILATLFCSFRPNLYAGTISGKSQTPTGRKIPNTTLVLLCYKLGALC